MYACNLSYCHYIISDGGGSSDSILLCIFLYVFCYVAICRAHIHYKESD